ncbi:PxKF domain-containing protein [uncultured Phycicoccus sp.]|uniref:PxKF domain-containing protein n=1 Tax=uncultured Phycicoccus sp. TaxID=661422 RepID=UPI002633A9E4|nr:PxKF domain-containing protein [uncultured Phycicoccus sp.]
MLLTIGGTAALADDISNSLDNTVDATVEVMPLAPGGAVGTTTLRVIATDNDGKQNCNLNGQRTFRANITSSNTAVATVSPGSITFADCDAPQTITVTSGVAGTARVSLTQPLNNTQGTFNLEPATFDVVVAAVKTATSTSLSCPASVVYSGSAQTPCSATTTGQNGFTATPTLSYSENTVVGTASVTATYAGDATHLSSSDTKTFAITKAASSTAITCTDQTYTGAALEPCSARATGVGGLDVAVTPTYTNNTGAGVAGVSATYAGDANHNGSSATQTFRIDQAAATCTVTGFDGTYDGAAHGLTGTCTGVGGSDLSSGLSLGGSHTSAGSHSVPWSFDGGTNYASQSGTATVTIARAPSSVTVTCPDTETYTAAPQTPCTATVTGVGGLSQSVSVDHTANTNVGTATATADYAGGPNHLASFGTGSFKITKATTSTTVTCAAGPHVYTGSALTPCTATATGPGLSQSLTPAYSANVDAGLVNVSAAYAGGANYWASSGASSFTIDQAESVVTVDCPESVVYTGQAHEPCSARVTGAGDLDETLEADYADNIDAGTATAGASYAGDANHTAGSGAAEFAIDRAPSTVTVTCPTSEVYTGARIEPCSASVTGAGGLSEDGLEVSYTDNEVVGTAIASATYGGDANHTGDSGSATFDITKATSTTLVTCASGPFVYTGDPIRPCSASVTGVGGLNESPSVSYQDNVDAGEATASASYTGGDNHDGSSDSETFVIGQADATCVISGFDGKYDGNAHGLTGSCTGVDDADLSDSLDLGGTYTAAGTYEVDWSFDGGRNYTDQSGTATVEIAKATSTVVVTCDDGPFVYTGDVHEPCTATVTGIGLNQSVPVSYENNTGAGTATASAAYPGDVNHQPGSGSATFVIDKAPSSVTLICDGDRTFTGSAVKPCSATASGAGMSPVILQLSYSDNVNAGTASVTAAWDGDVNHTGSSASTTFVIDKATSSVTVTCTAGPHVYTGSALTPCSAKATGAGALDESLVVEYTDNTDAGTAHASASFAGDSNHTGSTGSTTFVIAQAPSSIAIVCNGAKVFTGSAIQPCTATASGAGMAPITRPVSYTDNVNAGTAKADSAWDGDANHTGSTGSTEFTIAKAPSTVTVTCPTAPVYFAGYALTPACTARATGVGGLDVAVSPVTFTDNTAVGTATAWATYGGDANHDGSTGSTTFQILPWTTSGFFKPVDMGTSTATVWNTVKNGSTVPLKFRLFSGSTELTSTTMVKGFSAVTVNCTSAAEDVIEELSTTGGTSLRYDSTGTQFIQNWQTPKKAGACYKVTMTAQDGSTIAAHFKLK